MMHEIYTELEEKTVVVTGGLGFIGTNLIRELENRGHQVWACDQIQSQKLANNHGGN